MSKRKIIDKKNENSINSDKIFKFFESSIYNKYALSFPIMDNLYLGRNLLTGGDLRYHISRYRTFSGEQTRFLIICII